MGKEASPEGVQGIPTGDTPTPKKFNKQIGLGVLARLKNSLFGSDIQVPTTFDGKAQK